MTISAIIEAAGLPCGWTACEVHHGFVIATSTLSSGIPAYGGWEIAGVMLTRSWSTRAQVRKAIRDGQTYRGPPRAPTANP